MARLDPDPDHPNGGVICIKGKAAPELLYHPERLNYPLRRTRPKGDINPGWQSFSWDQALDEITGRPRATREHYGARAVVALYALFGDTDRPGGNVVFPKAPFNS